MTAAHRNSSSSISFNSSLAILFMLAIAPFTMSGLIAQQPTAAAARPSQPLRSLSMVSGDFDEDGVADLAIGAANDKGGAIILMRGNLDAVAPQTHASWLAAGRHELGNPFLQPAETIHLTAAPDMLTAADVNGDGHLDLAFASKNSAVLRVIAGTGTGSFSPNAVSIALPGDITALAAYRPGAPFLGEVLVAGYQTKQGARLSIVSYGRTGLKIESTYDLPGEATAFSVANLDDDLVPDTAIVAGGQLLILHGRNAFNGGGRLEVLPVDRIEAIAAGEFLFDRHGLMQLAALNSDGDVLILAHQGIDSRPFTPREIAGMRHLRPGSPTLAQLAGNIANEPWTVVETDAQAGVHPAGSDAPILLRSRISGAGGDDLVLLNPSQQQRVTIAHSMSNSNRPESLAARTTAVSLRSSEEFVAAAAVRVNADGRPGLAMLKKSSLTPEFTVPSAGNTFYVNTTADNTGNTIDTDDGTRCSNGSSEVCTLRDAVTFANTDAADNISASKSDTIMVPGGTYPLTWQAGTVDSNGNAVTHLEVLGPVTFAGATSGGGVTINATSNDVAFTINPGPVGSFNPSGESFVFDTTLENITIENGTNPNNLANNANANDVGGGINWDAFGTGNLTLTNVNIKSCTVLYGPGGGIWVENSAGGGSGTLTLTGGLITKNTTAEEGGGIYVAYPYAAVVATNTDIYDNAANSTLYPNDPGAYGAGGGLYFNSRNSTTPSPQSTLTGVVIDANSASQEGGGIYTNSGILLRSSVVASNTSGAWGGGVYAQEGPGETSTTITNAQFLGNSATTTGGGIFVGNDNPSSDIPSLVVSLSRISGNASTNGTTGLALEGVGAATASENWWGCNAGPANTPCDKADSAAGTNPWAVMGLKASATTIGIGSSIGLTVSLNTDSNGHSITGAFPAVQGENITYLVTGVTASPALTSGDFSDTGVDNATLTPSTTGSGSVSATFDEQTLSVNFTVESLIKSTLTSPTPGSILAGPSITFSWTPETGATQYYLSVGSTGVGSNNVYNSGWRDVTSWTATGLPTNGETLYVRLSTDYNGLVVYSDATYEASTQAAITSPTAGSTLTGPSVTFNWSAATGATQYYLSVGSTGVGSTNIYNSGWRDVTSWTADPLPTNGEKLYVRLSTDYSGAQVHADYTYTASTQAAITSPTAGSILTGPSVTFNWSAATGATQYYLSVGSTGVGSTNVYNSGWRNALSWTATGLPANGETLYVRLSTDYNGIVAHSDTTYTAATAAVLTTPTPGTTLSGSSVTFDWTAGTTGATQYYLSIGSTGVGSTNIYNSGWRDVTSWTATGLPANGETLYVRLSTDFGGTVVHNDYTYTAH